MKTAICIASGTTLTQEDVDYCKGKGKVYVVNDCHKLAPWADVLYACDGVWWDEYQGVPEFTGQKWSIDFAACKKYGLNQVGVNHQFAWSNYSNSIATGGNSGFQALNLAVIQGAERVILLGYDMKYRNNKLHWFGNHPNALNRGANFKKWIKNFELAKPHIPVPVINCSPDSDLNCFDKMDLREAL